MVNETAAAPPDQASHTTNNAQTVIKKEKFIDSDIDRKAMEQERLGEKRKRKPEPEPELELFNPLEGRPDAWQLGEPVNEFIKRLPPGNTSTPTCPWIWAVNPHRNRRDKLPSPREDNFTTRGKRLLDQSLETRRKIQEDGVKGPRAMVTRQLSQESKALEGRITSLARETYVLSGKVGLINRCCFRNLTSTVDAVSQTRGCHSDVEADCHKCHRQPAWVHLQSRD